MDLSLVALYDAIAGDDSDVSGAYPQTVQTLSDAMHGFWQSYDARQASVKALNTSFRTGARLSADALARLQLQFAQDCTAYRRTMARYRKAAQDALDTYRVLDDSCAYKREFARVVKVVIPCHAGFVDVEYEAYGRRALRALEDGPSNLEAVYKDITRTDSDVSGTYDFTVQTLSDAMNGFWRSYDSEPASARRCAEYRNTMEGYRDTAYVAFARHTTWQRVADAMLGKIALRRQQGDNPRGVEILVSLHKYDTDRMTIEYKMAFAALLKSMVPYLQVKKAEAFAHEHELLPEIHALIDSFRATRENQFIL